MIIFFLTNKIIGKKSLTLLKLFEKKKKKKTLLKSFIIIINEKKSSTTHIIYDNKNTLFFSLNTPYYIYIKYIIIK